MFVNKGDYTADYQVNTRTLYVNGKNVLLYVDNAQFRRVLSRRRVAVFFVLRLIEPCFILIHDYVRVPLRSCEIRIQNLPDMNVISRCRRILIEVASTTALSRLVESTRIPTNPPDKLEDRASETVDHVPFNPARYSAISSCPAYRAQSSGVALCR